MHLDLISELVSARYSMHYMDRDNEVILYLGTLWGS